MRRALRALDANDVARLREAFFLLLAASMVVARRAPPAQDPPKKGDFFTHVASGEIVRVLAVARGGISFERTGVGRVTLAGEAFARGYVRAASAPTQGGNYRQRNEGTLRLELELFHGAWILRVEERGTRGAVPGATPRRVEHRFRRAADATFWFERLRRIDELPR